MDVILRQLPFLDCESYVHAPTGPVAVRSFQIIVWMSITGQGTDMAGLATPRFPAIVDIGNNHNLSMRRQHLRDWAGFSDEMIVPIGQVFLGKDAVPLVLARAWIWPNQPNSLDIDRRRKPLALELPEGIAVYPTRMVHAPRLPLLGLRALVWNQLTLTVDGKRRFAELRK